MDPSRLLLDSHVLVWLVNQEGRIGEKALEIINAAEMVCVSVASIWELNIKMSLGRMQLPKGFEELIVASGFTELPVTLAHASVVRSINMPHSDPFDKMLLAQTVSENLTLLTADNALLQTVYPTLDATK